MAVKEKVAAPTGLVLPRSGDSTAKGTILVRAFAVAGAFYLVLQATVWGRWLADGPVQLDRFRDTSDGSWYLAIAYQAAGVLVFAGVLIYVVRGCRRAGRLTFDASFMIAGLCTYWLDPAANYVIPNYTYSQQWINVADWVGYIPGARYPDAGRVPEPFLFLIPMYAAGWLMFAMIIGKFIDIARRRLRNPTTGRVVAVALAGGLAIDIVFELPMFAFNLWSNQGAPRIGFFPSSGALYPVTEMFIAMLCFGTLSLIRFYKNDRGETIVERGMADATPRARATRTTLAMIGLMNLMFTAMAGLWTTAGLFSGPWKEMKPWVNAGVCDDVDGGMRNTRYGPCPGSDEFRMPLPGSLPGSKPANREEYLNGPTQCEECEPLEHDEG